jgi:hypothetical protein
MVRFEPCHAVTRRSRGNRNQCQRVVDYRMICAPAIQVATVNAADRADGVLRHWAAAGLSLLALAILFAAAMVGGR